MITASEFKSRRQADDVDIENTFDSAIALGMEGRAIKIRVRAAWAVEALDRVMHRYRACGWRAELVLDGRDGDYVELVPA